jgi:UDP-3-O-[3-hydroxymyristoyl] glucosamine N-acyltransferase
MSLNLHQLAKALQIEYRGDADLLISGVASPASAVSGDLCYLLHRNTLGEIAASQCSAVILSPQLGEQVKDKSLLLSDNPHFSFVRAIDILGLEGASRESGVHPSAQIAPGASLGQGVSVGANAVIEDAAEIGAHSMIGAGSVVGRGAIVGSNCHLHSRVTLAPAVRLGDRCILQSGAVIGADGFGLVFHQQRWHRVPQMGSVVIGDDVEIGANTTVDRGALDDTVIEEGCKLDNQIQVGHNVRIGAHTAIAGCAAIAGSAIIGRYCKIAGGAGVLGHLSIADHVTITAMSLVTRDVDKAGVYSSGTPLMENRLWHRSNATYKTLPKLARTVAKLDKKGE